MSRVIYIIVFCSIIVITQFGCKKLVDVEVPSNVITVDNVYNNDVTAIAVLNGLYTKMSGSNYTATSIPNISFWTGLSADEFTLWNGSTAISPIAYYKNNLSGQTDGGQYWSNIYQDLYICNAAIEGMEKSNSLTPAVKKQLLGEAKFMRAFFYFYLVNLYGDVPLVLHTDYTINATLTRSSSMKVYEQIIADLKDAQELLANGYVKSDVTTLYASSSTERIRPSKAAATALLARTYLYKGDWFNAESQATSIIDNVSVYDTVPLNKVFLKNSKEAIWQLPPVSTIPGNTAEAYFYVLTNPTVGVNNQHPVYLSNFLLNSFEAGDKRKLNGNWINIYTDATGTYYYPYKFKDITQGAGINPTEYRMLLRIGEQYLIRAEARAKLNNITGAQNDLNVIRKRAGVGNTTASNQVSLLVAILHERQVELFTELGHRWLDIKRTGNVDAVMTTVTASKGGTWNSYKQLYPILNNELLANPNLSQTPGY
jgi:hypothetical protein